MVPLAQQDSNYWISIPFASLAFELSYTIFKNILNLVFGMFDNISRKIDADQYGKANKKQSENHLLKFNFPVCLIEIVYLVTRLNSVDIGKMFIRHGYIIHT